MFKQVNAPKEGSTIYVVLYLRKSSKNEEQEASIPTQRKACHEYARRMGWVILREYVDEGLSGSKDTEKRIQFHQMIADASKGDFSAVLCFDTSRFGRLDSQEGAPFKFALRKAGVHLETTREGKIDWNTSAGRIVDAVKAESDNDFSLKFAYRSLNGRLARMNEGYYPHGRIPFGYDRQYWYDGKVMEVVPRKQKSHKGRGFRQKLLINKGEEKAIKWAFNEYATKDISVRAIALALNGQGIAPPKGKNGWTVRSVLELLSNPCYVGDVAIGVQRGGRKGKFEQAERQVIQGGCPAIVSRETWDVVQAKRAEAQRTHSRVHSGKSGALTGILICGNCGFKLTKKVKNGKTLYHCVSKFLRPNCSCSNWRVHEEILLPEIIQVLRDSVNAEILRQIEAKPDKSKPQDLEALKKQIEEADKRVERGSENLLQADPEFFPALQKKLGEWKSEATKLRNTLALLDVRQDDQRVWVDWWKTVEGKLITLSGAGYNFDGVKAEEIGEWVNPQVKARMLKEKSIVKPPVKVHRDALRELLKRFKTEVTLTWTPNGKRHYSLNKGVIRAEFGQHVFSGDSLDGKKSIPN